MHYVDLGESFPTKIYCLLATVGFDTAENEPCKVCDVGASRVYTSQSVSRADGRSSESSPLSVSVASSKTTEEVRFNATIKKPIVCPRTGPSNDGKRQAEARTPEGALDGKRNHDLPLRFVPTSEHFLISLLSPRNHRLQQLAWLACHQRGRWR